MASTLNAKQIQSLLKSGKAGRYPAGYGLYFRVSNIGTGSWFYRYTINGKRREISLGKFPKMTLATANAKIAELKDMVSEEVDPLAEKKRVSSSNFKTVNELGEDWLVSDIEKRLKHPHIPRRVFEKDIAPYIGEMAVGRVTPLDIRGIINQINESGRPSISNDALMYCKQLFRHGIRLNLIIHNPADAFTVRHAGGVEKSRSRVLSLEEIKATFKVLRENSTEYTRENYLATALLLVLGVRKGELIAAQWDEFDLERQTWDVPSSRSKTGVGICIPLPNCTIDWLQELKVRSFGSPFVFPTRRSGTRRGYISDDTLNHALSKMFGQSYKKPVNSPNKLGEADVEHFVLHDLRRTCRSLLAAEGVPGHVAERCLNHKIKGVEGIYDRYDYFEERREALERVASKVSVLMSESV